MSFNPAVSFRAAFYTCMLLCALALSAAIFSAGFLPGSCNLENWHVSGKGDLQIRNDNEQSSTFASIVDGDVDFTSRRQGGDFEVNYIVASASSDGKWKNAYRVSGQGAGQKVSFEATKIEGPASFAGKISCHGYEGGEDFDSVISIDTRDGNATLSARVWNATTGKPATTSELDAVGKFLINHQLNVSLHPITEKGWLEFCSTITDEEIPRTLRMAPVDSSFVPPEEEQEEGEEENASA